MQQKQNLQRSTPWEIMQREKAIAQCFQAFVANTRSRQERLKQAHNFVVVWGGLVLVKQHYLVPLRKAFRT